LTAALIETTSILENAMKRTIPLLLIVGIAGCGWGKSTAELLGQLKDKDSSQRIHAIKALETRQRDADVVVPALAQLLEDEDAFVRRDAAQALGRFGTDAKTAVSALLRARRDRHASVRKAAGDALQAIDPNVQ
jgi:HEAT repeat protein